MVQMGDFVVSRRGGALRPQAAYDDEMRSI